MGILISSLNLSNFERKRDWWVVKISAIFIFISRSQWSLMSGFSFISFSDAVITKGFPTFFDSICLSKKTALKSKFRCFSVWTSLWVCTWLNSCCFLILIEEASRFAIEMISKSVNIIAFRLLQYTLKLKSIILTDSRMGIPPLTAYDAWADFSVLFLRAHMLRLRKSQYVFS